MNKTIMAVVITAIVAGGAGFYGGNLYSQNKNPRNNFNRQGVGAYAGMGQRNNAQNADFSGGEIIKKDDTGITVKLRDGSSKIIFVSGATKIMKSVEGLIGDLVIGGQVTVTGSKNQDGSITAESIQIRPVAQTNQ